MSPDMQWSAHPARERPRDLVLFVSVLLLSMGATLSAFQSLFLALLAATILLAAVSPFLFPTHYVLNDRGIREERLGRTRARTWQELKRVHIGRQAALLSPFAQATWMDRYRGIVIFFGGADREALVARLQNGVGKQP